ncbi:MAG TPA: class II aldolase/adducin family protein [Solirubrobacterales bacterium]|jgi:L-fuculose-phosphate aldolase
MADEREVRREVVEVARELLRSGAVIGTLGNVSARRGDGFIVTPTRRDYRALQSEELVVIDEAGNASGGEPSLEWQLHAAAYAAGPEVGGVVHTHSPHATAWSFLGEELLPELEDNAYYRTGPIRTAALAVGGSAELAVAATEVLRGSRAALLAGHGVVATGATAGEAAVIAAVVERQAQVAWLLRR